MPTPRAKCRDIYVSICCFVYFAAYENVFAFFASFTLSDALLLLRSAFLPFFILFVQFSRSTSLHGNNYAVFMAAVLPLLWQQCRSFHGSSVAVTMGAVDLALVFVSPFPPLELRAYRLIRLNEILRPEFIGCVIFLSFSFSIPVRQPLSPFCCQSSLGFPPHNIFSTLTLRCIMHCVTSLIRATSTRLPPKSLPFAINAIYAAIYAV